LSGTARDGKRVHDLTKMADGGAVARKGKLIMIAVDGSETSDAAVKFAIETVLK
jgi:hypothetical protein